jgi:hypothetical protein
MNKRWTRRRVILAVLLTAISILGGFFGFLYTPSLPIPAGTVIRITDGDLRNPVLGHYYVWAFTVERCCAHVVGGWEADHGVGWGVWGPNWWTGRQECTPHGAEPSNGTLRMGAPFNPGSYFFGMGCGLVGPTTITITQTIQLAYT